MKLFAASAVIAATLFSAFPAAAIAQTAPTPTTPAPIVLRAPDYAQDADWLCRPGRSDACAADQTATVIAANGKRTIEPFVPAAAPKFDCFYVYPTVSLDTTPNSDLTAGPEEKQVAAFQAARFAKNCRVFAPLYRQVTLTALRDIMTGKAVPADRALAYADVRAAWYDYLRRDNQGRGVVLIEIGRAHV